MLKHIYIDLVRETSSLGSIVVYGVIAVLFYFLNHVDVFLQLVTAIVLGYAITALLRLLFFKHRPKKEKFKNLIEKIDAATFPSLHSMRATFFGIVLMNFFQNMLVSAVIILCIAGVGYARILDKRHYTTDVIAGIILGIAIGLFVIRIF